MAHDAPGITQIMVLNQKECLLFAGKWNKKNEGYSWQDAQKYVTKISGAATWVGRDVTIQAVPVRLAKAMVDIAKAQQFIWNQTLERIAKKPKEVKREQGVRNVETPASLPSPRGQGMVRRADHYVTQRYQEGND